MKQKLPILAMTLSLIAAAEVFTLTGCGENTETDIGAAEADENTFSEYTQDDRQELGFGNQVYIDGEYIQGEPVYKTNDADFNTEEYRLRKILAQASGVPAKDIDELCYEDVNSDGKKELVAALSPSQQTPWEVWYVNHDGSVCKKVVIDGAGYERHDYAKIELLTLKEEVHVVINFCDLIGIGKSFTILKFTGDEPECIYDKMYGYLHQDENGDILLVVEGYDAQWVSSGDSGYLVGHTWRDAYLYYEDGVYKEYGATMLSEEEFLKMENAQKTLDAICKEESNFHAGRGKKELEVTGFFWRANNIIQIQCEQGYENGDIFFFYYTCRYEGNRILDDGSPEKTDGMVGEYLSRFEVTY